MTAASGTSVSVPFTSVGTFDLNNIYTAQLSNAAGSFTSPTPIGTLSGNAISGNIDATIPKGTFTGTGYRIRVISSIPAVTGSNNGSNLTINLSTNSIAPPALQTIDVGADGTTLTVNETPAALSRNWAYSATSGGPYTNFGSSGDTFTPNFAAPGTYYVVCISTFTCGTVTSNEVQINVSGTISTGTITGSPFCVTASSGSSVFQVPFTSLGTFGGGNIFTAQLSDPSGGFGSPQNIGTGNSSPISATILANTPTGTGYRIRVISSDPAIISTDNGTDLTINLPEISIAPTGVQNINAGVNGTMLVVTEAPVANSREWFYGIDGINFDTPTGVTATSYIPNFAVQNTYYVVCKSTFDCGTITSNAVQVIVSATVTTGPIAGSPFCVRAALGTAISVPFTSKGLFGGGNIYTAELSDLTGNFPGQDIGNLSSSSNSGTIIANIPANTPTGALYRIRVKSSEPIVNGSPNGSPLTINLSTNSIVPPDAQELEVNINGTPLTVTETPAAVSRIWAIGTALTGPYNNTASTGLNYVPNFQIPGTYYIVCKSQFPCGEVISNVVQVHVKETITTGTIEVRHFV